MQKARLGFEPPKMGQRLGWVWVWGKAETERISERDRDFRLVRDSSQHQLEIYLISEVRFCLGSWDRYRSKQPSKAHCPCLRTGGGSSRSFTQKIQGINV